MSRETVQRHAYSISLPVTARLYVALPLSVSLLLREHCKASWRRSDCLVEMEASFVRGGEQSFAENLLARVLWQFQVMHARVH